MPKYALLSRCGNGHSLFCDVLSKDKKGQAKNTIMVVESLIFFFLSLLPKIQKKVQIQQVLIVMYLYYNDPSSEKLSGDSFYKLESGSISSSNLAIKDSTTSDERLSLGGEPLLVEPLISRKTMQRKIKFMKRTIILIISFVICLVLFGKLNNSENSYTGGLIDNNSTPEYQQLKPYGYNDEASLIQEERKVTLKDLRSGKFYPDIKQIQWIASNDSGTYLTKKNTQYIVSKISDPDYNKVLYDSKLFEHDNKTYEIVDFVASPDLKFALLSTNKTLVWRHSSLNYFWILDVANGHVSPVVAAADNNGNFPRISFVKWAPDSNRLAFVLNNNVYVKDLAADIIDQVTFDGGENIFNGKPDWVYEEEVFENDFALWWSPSSEFLTFLKFNDTKVDNFPLAFYVPDENPESSYPVDTHIKYPKAGYTNPNVSVHVFNIAKNETGELFNNFDDKQDFKQYLFTELLWVGNDKIYLRATNRISNVLKIIIIDAVNLTFDVGRHETIEDGWFELIHDTVYVAKDESKNRFEEGYIDTVTVDGYNHLAYFSPPTSAEPKVILTQGDYEVVDGVSNFDPETNQVYFISTKYSSIDRHLYSVDLLTGDKLVALTDDEQSGYYSASFSTDSKNILLSYLGPNVPYQKIITLDNTNKGEVANKQFFFTEGQNITTNDKLSRTLKEYDLPTVEYKTINLGKDENNEDIIANLREIKPFNFDASGNHKYPLFVYVYQGPNSQLINTRFSISILQVIASTLDAVVVTVDGRGTGFKGKKFRSVVYQNLSHYETIDQINAAKIFTKLPYIDSERTLIYGHSYGGYMTLKTLENDDDKVFKYGISGAPVTDWRLYDSIYTERYMGLPQENFDNYYTGAVGNFNISNFQATKRFLMLHGTGDDNVHIQNLFRFLDKLNRASVENNFDLMVFPDSNHGVSYHNAGYIMYNKIIWWARLAFDGAFDVFDEYDYHNGNLKDKVIGNEWKYSTLNSDLDDAEYLRA